MAYAREQQAKYNKEGKETMDHAQITGATSSYARKYALNGLFAIDDVRDADSMDNTQTPASPKPTTVTTVATGPMCEEHGVPYVKFEKNGASWYSHKNADGTWCNQAKKKDEILEVQVEDDIPDPTEDWK